MLNKFVIAVGILVGSGLAAWAASSTLSGLNSGGPISGSDLFYDVQTVGVGGVKVTGTQFLSFVYGNVGGACSATSNGIFTCNSSNTGTVGIAAGNNITTSGTSMNVTVNVVSTPTFSSITTTLASITGWLTAAGVNAQTASIAGNLTASTVAFPGFLTASGANLNTATIVGLGGATQCVQSVAGVLSGTGSTCGTGQFSIAAGSNISTSGTANNITINVISTPTFGSVTTTTATISGITSTQCVQAISGLLSGTGSACSSGGAVGGANTNVQFNNSSAFGGDGGFIYSSGSGQVGVKSAGGYGLSSLTSATTKTIDAMLYRDAAVSVLALADFATNTNPAGFRVYNTTDNVSTNVAPTNYERGVFDWTTTNNVLTIGTQKSGTGTGRDVTYTANVLHAFITKDFANGIVGFSNGITNPQVVMSNTTLLGWSVSTPLASITMVSGFTNAASGVIGFTQGGTAVNGWFNWGGEARLSADYGTTTTTLAAVTATSQSLTVSLQASRNYSFHVFLPFSTAAGVGGIKAAFGGTAVATNFIGDGICSDGASGLTVTRVSALTSTFVATTNSGTTPKCEMDGTFEVNTAGTFNIQFAQNAQSGASTVTRGAYMRVYDTP